jgi:pimeloyl-[acyl-carrier protein] synthase
MDIMADLASPLPVIVIAEMLGVPADERTQLKKWSDDLVTTLDFTDDPSRAAIADRAAVEFIAYFRAIIRQRRAEPRDDLISAMVAAEERGDALSEDEMLAMCVLILVAGHETTTNLIGNGMLSLLQNPDQLRRLIAEPSLIESAVEEMLRYEYPVQSTIRIPLEDVGLGGKTLRKGQVTVVMVAAANRDPAQFSDPDILDIARRPQ